MNNKPESCQRSCSCPDIKGGMDFIVITGGPGAGKTATLEVLRKILCHHITILPEAASIIFSGGFWRLPSSNAKAAAQRVIFQVQREMEFIAREEKKWMVGLCDRGTLDGYAYWPEDQPSFWDAVRTQREKEYQRYKAVIHLHSPNVTNGYNYQNPLRVESDAEAKIIDKKIASVWSGHPNYHAIDATVNFWEKVQKAIDLVNLNLPECCREKS